MKCANCGTEWDAPVDACPICIGCGDAHHVSAHVQKTPATEKALPMYVHKWMAEDQAEILKLRSQVDQLTRERDEARGAVLGDQSDARQESQLDAPDWFEQAGAVDGD